jgi:hypothetical protein
MLRTENKRADSILANSKFRGVYDKFGKSKAIHQANRVMFGNHCSIIHAWQSHSFGANSNATK